MGIERPTCRECACTKVCEYFANENEKNLDETCPLCNWENYFVPKREWISVGERLPDEKSEEQRFYDPHSLALLDVEVQLVSDEVLVTVKDFDRGILFVTTDYTSNRKWNNWENGDYIVTHWMPLPTPPRKEDDGK